MKKPALILTYIITAFAFLTGLLVYDRLPERVASHWDINGQVDGYMGRFGGAFFLPFLLIGLLLLFMIIIKVDPKRQNIEGFKEYFYNFIAVLFAFLFLIYIDTILWSLGTKISPNIIMPIGLAGLFYYTGIMVGKAKQNWSIGIRTPWTLSSEKVWDKTHRQGKAVFQIVAAVCLIGAFFPAAAFYFVMIPIVVATVYLLFYSYLEFKKEQK